MLQTLGVMVEQLGATSEHIDVMLEQVGARSEHIDVRLEHDGATREVIGASRLLHEASETIRAFSREDL